MFLIIVTLFLFEGLAFADPSTQIMNRKISSGWDYCYGNGIPQRSIAVRCSSDCESLEYCMNGRQFTVSCMQQTGKKYCDVATNSCRDHIDVCYNSRDFCPRDGVFPDLTNCKRSVYCDGDSMNPYECEYGNWNYKTGRCEEDVECKTYTRNTGCSGSYYNALVPHQNPHWFVFCYWGRPLLAECPGETYTFDSELGNCRFQCEHQENVCENGKYADERDSTIYYDCYRVGNKWATIEKRCATGTQFNERLQVCTRNGESWPTSTPYPGFRRLLPEDSEEESKDNNQTEIFEEKEYTKISFGINTEDPELEETEDKKEKENVEQ